MIPERLVEAIGQFPINESQAFSEMTDVSRTAITISLASVNTALIWFISRQMEGTVNTKIQKGALIAMGTGFTVANALINHQIWT